MSIVKIRLVKTIGIVLTALLSVGTVQAALVSYEFIATAGVGSFLNLTGNPDDDINLDGVNFIATGATISDTDVDPEITIGQYASHSNYDFIADGLVFASFTSDLTSGESYFQDCGDSTSVGCVGLSSIADPVGFLGFFTEISADPNAGGIEIGSMIAPFFSASFGTLSLTNLAGDLLNLSSVEMTELTAIVPLPAALPLFISALVGLGFVARRKKT